jgi:hypothetical protein
MSIETRPRPGRLPATVVLDSADIRYATVTTLLRNHVKGGDHPDLHPLSHLSWPKPGNLPGRVEIT